MPTPPRPLAVIRAAVAAWHEALDEGWSPPGRQGGPRSALGEAVTKLGRDPKKSGKNIGVCLDTAVALGMEVRAWRSVDPAWAAEQVRRYRTWDEEFRSTALPQRAHPPAVKAGYIPPELPEEDTPLPAYIEQQIANQDREKAFKRASEWMRFEVDGGAPFCLAFVGDPHADQCDLRLLRDHTQLIADTPRMWAVGLGDWLNSWSSKLRGQYAMQDVTEKGAYRLAQWLFDMPIWWLILLGNHDGQRWHGHGSPLRWMERASGSLQADWQAKFEVVCGDARWRVWAAHNFPGTSQFNVLHGPGKRAQYTGAEADLYICGDHHVYGLAHTQHEHTGRTYWVGRARGYKSIDNYAIEKGYGEHTIGHSIAGIFDPRDGSLVCFSDLHKAVEYLKSIMPRVRVPARSAKV